MIIEILLILVLLSLTVLITWLIFDSITRRRQGQAYENYIQLERLLKFKDKHSTSYSIKGRTITFYKPIEQCEPINNIAVIKKHTADYTYVVAGRETGCAFFIVKKPVVHVVKNKYKLSNRKYYKLLDKLQEVWLP